MVRYKIILFIILLSVSLIIKGQANPLQQDLGLTNINFIPCHTETYQTGQKRDYFLSTIQWLCFTLALLGILIIIVVWKAYSLQIKNYVLTEKVKQLAGSTGKFPKYEKTDSSNPPNQEDKEIADKLLIYMKEYKIYKESDLTLESLANKLGISRHKLSRAVNRTSAHNINQYINEFRIHETIKLMNDLEYHQLSLEELMEHVGFNSRSTFYESFKKITNLTPAQYWKRVSQFHRNQDG